MRIFLIIVAVIIAVPVGCFFVLWDYEVLRYRLTYVVEVDGVERTGSGVIQVHYEDTTRLPLPRTGVGHEVTGEAVVVDLGDGRYLFSLLEEGGLRSPNALPNTVFEGPLKLQGNMLRRARRLNKLKPSAKLANDQLPMLVMFRDINDPLTVSLVNAEDLSTNFGMDAELKDVTLEITDEPVTAGNVERVLRWWCELRAKRARLNGKTGAISDNELSNNLGTGSFRIGDCS